MLLLTACADPLQNVERLDEVVLAEGAATASLAPGAGDTADAPLVVDQLLAGPDAAGPDAAGPDAAGPVVTDAPQRRGFLRLFGLRAAGPATAADAALPLAAGPRVDAGTGPDALQVSPGSLLPYGQIATVCGLSEADMGSRIAVASGYEIYDTAASTTTLRVHYITGFPDGCARIFSAALVLFGDVGTHEAIRYLPASSGMTYSATDTAYEQVKAQFCAAPSGQPCGRNLDRLSGHTTFVTIYETFGTNPEWGEIFLHDGQVMAIDVRRGS